MESVKDITYNTQDALAVALAIYKKQGYAKTVNVVGEESRKPNKEILEQMLLGTVPMEQVDYSSEELQDIMRMGQELMMKKMADTITEYETHVLQILEHKTVKPHQLGILSSIPLMHDNIKKKQKKQESFSYFQENSKHLGMVNSRYYGTVELLEKKWHDKGFWIYTFVEGGKNVMKWLTGTEYEGFNKGTKLKISGVVKAHNTTQWYGCETVMTRCKLMLDTESTRTDGQKEEK